MSFTQMLFYDGYVLILASLNCTDALIGDSNTTKKGKEVEANVMNAAKGYTFTFVCYTLWKLTYMRYK